MCTPSHPKQASPTLPSSLFRDVTQRKFAVSYRRFGTLCRSHLQGQAVQEEIQSVTLMFVSGSQVFYCTLTLCSL